MYWLILLYNDATEAMLKGMRLTFVFFHRDYSYPLQRPKPGVELSQLGGSELTLSSLVSPVAPPWINPSVINEVHLAS